MDNLVFITAMHDQRTGSPLSNGSKTSRNQKEAALIRRLSKLRPGFTVSTKGSCTVGLVTITFIQFTPSGWSYQARALIDVRAQVSSLGRAPRSCWRTRASAPSSCASASASGATLFRIVAPTAANTSSSTRLTAATSSLGPTKSLTAPLPSWSLFTRSEMCQDSCCKSATVIDVRRR